MADETIHALRRLRKGTDARKLESPTLDFKAPSTTPKATFINVAEAAVCFANAVGGTVVLGVSEGLEVYGTSTGRYCRRRGTDCLPMTADDVARLREERRRASAILRDLVERDVVVRTSDQTRGQNVRYGPGPALRTRQRS